MRAAVLDLGTNTFNILIADVKGNKYETIYSGRQVVKLGEKSINKNIIGENAFQRALIAMELHAEKLRDYKVTKVKAYATSAIREAENGQELISLIKKFSRIEVEVISGDKEAELIYKGNRLAVQMGSEKHLIMDIGGGSTEFIIGNNKKVFWEGSFKLGVARLLEMFRPEDPITEATLKKIHEHIRKNLNSLVVALKKYPVQKLVGSSGAFESIVDMIGKEKIAPGKSNYDIDMDDYFFISEKTIYSTIAEREQMKGLMPMRRDMIVLSYLLINFVLNESGIRQLTLSTYSLKEGGLWEMMHA